MDYTTGRPHDSLENTTIQNLKVVKLNDTNVTSEIIEQDEAVARIAILENTVNQLVAIINNLLGKTIPTVP